MLLVQRKDDLYRQSYANKYLNYLTGDYRNPRKNPTAEEASPQRRREGRIINPELSLLKEKECCLTERNYLLDYSTRYAPTFVQRMKINGRNAQVLIDTGAAGNFISPEYVAKHKIATQHKGNRSYILRGIDKQPVATGVVATETRLVELEATGGHMEELQFDVTIASRYDAILGMPWADLHKPDFYDNKGRNLNFPRCQHGLKVELMTFGAMKRLERKKRGTVMMAVVAERDLLVATADREWQLPDEYAEYKDLFEEPKEGAKLPEHKPWDHRIPLKEGKEPGPQPIYKISQEELIALRTYLETEEALGRIRKSQSPARYPILFVPKKDGTLRLCVDYRKLNDITIKNSYTLPLIQEIQDRTQGAKIFTTIDLREAYYKVRMAKGEEWKTTFGTRFGHYEYTVMPFGLTGAPATFQALINDVLRENLDRFCTAYLDDILIYSQNEKEHRQHVRWVLNQLRKAALPIKGEKCEFHKTEVEFLGYIISDKGIRMDQRKVQAILEWPAPTNVKETQSFLGFANFYRRFIRGYSGIVKPLTDLTRDEMPWEWGLEQQKAFQEIKKRFQEEPVLLQFDPAKKIKVETDASDYAMGMVLCQEDESGRWHPVAFYSRKMNPTEENYPVHDKELMAIVEAFKEWRHYLQGPKFTVEVLSDHKNLTYFTTTKQLNRRQARWAEELAQYNFTIKYQKGSENGRADALSRRPDYQKDARKPPNEAIFEEKEGILTLAAAPATIEEESWEIRIKEAYKRDSYAQAIQDKEVKHNGRIQETEGLLTIDGLIYVPTKLQDELYEKYHEGLLGGHLGVENTLERITRMYYYPGIRKDLQQRIRKCDACQRSKSARHRPYGLLQPNRTPNEPWEEVTMDFITDLPPSKDPATTQAYDAILVVVDRMTKYAYFLPFRKTMGATETAAIVLQRIIAEHGIPRRFISDRDTRFTSQFWRTMLDQLGSKAGLSTAFHPQTDGQTERTNQTLEQYLRCFADYEQTNWVALLPMAQFTYNNKKSATTGVSPFYANYGRELEFSREPKNLVRIAETARLQVEELKHLHQELSKDLEMEAYRMARWANKKRLEGPRLREGDKVYLLRKNIRTRRPNDKLDHKKLGPFKIKRCIRDTAFELELPPTMRIHNVFHISLLEPADPETPDNPPPEIDPETQEEIWEVEEILAVKKMGRQLKWLIKWKGWGHENNTWEPKSYLTDCSERVQAFYQANPQTTLGKSQWETKD